MIPCILSFAVTGFASTSSTASTISFIFEMISILRSERVSTKAMSFNRIASRKAFPPKYIIFWCNSFKMIRIHTVTHTAQMVNLEALGDKTDNEFIGNTVCKFWCSFNTKIAISLWGYITGPKPTSIFPSKIDFRPETLGRGIIKEHLKRLLSGVMRRAVSAVPSPIIVSQGVLSLFLR